MIRDGNLHQGENEAANSPSNDWSVAETMFRIRVELWMATETLTRNAIRYLRLRSGLVEMETIFEFYDQNIPFWHELPFAGNLISSLNAFGQLGERVSLLRDSILNSELALHQGLYELLDISFLLQQEAAQFNEVHGPGVPLDSEGPLPPQLTNLSLTTKVVSTLEIMELVQLL